MADGRSLLCFRLVCYILTSYLLLSLSIDNRLLSNEVDISPTWFLAGGNSRLGVTCNNCCTSASTSRCKKFFRARISYYSNAHASFQLERIIRSGDTAVNLNPGPDCIKCYLQNVRSLKAFTTDGTSSECKIALLRDIAYGYDLDIVCLTETWLNETISNLEILPYGYNMFRNDRQNRMGGGTLIAVKSNLSSRVVITAPISLECIAVEVDLSSSLTALFINCYRPPNGDKDFNHNLKTLLDTLNLEKYWGVFLLGDFNYPNINWIDGSGFTNSISSDDQCFANLMMDLYLFQLVAQPTRNENILDLVLTNLPRVISSIESGPSCAEIGLPSDHYPVIFDINVFLKFKVSNYKYCYDYKHADFEGLNNELSLLPLSTGVDAIESQEKLNEAWKQWTTFVFAAIDKLIPKVRRRESNNPPWISKELVKAIKHKKTLWRRVKKSTDERLRERFRILRQSIKNWIRCERKAYMRDIANEAFSNPKRFWSYYSFKNKSKPVPDKIKYKGVSISDDLERAEAFNDYFKSIYKDHTCCSPPDLCPVNSNINELLELIQVTPEDVFSLLFNLDVSKATGPDKLPAIILKMCAESLSPSLSVFINASLRTGLCISEWKQANISPVHKNGARDEVENFRQISLLPIVSKIQEKCVALKLVPHVSEILHPVQYGFQQGLSCANQLVEVFHTLV